MNDKKKILVVDDEEHIRDSLGFMLEKMGYAVKTEKDAANVFNLLAHEQFDIVVSDVTMPKINGHELARRVREQYPEIYIILISGYREEELKETLDGRGTHPDRYLAKPFSMRDLRVCLESI